MPDRLHIWLGGLSQQGSRALCGRAKAQCILCAFVLAMCAELGHSMPQSVSSQSGMSHHPVIQSSSRPSDHGTLRQWLTTRRHTSTSSGRQPPCRQMQSGRDRVRMAHASSLGSPLAWGAGPGRPLSLPSHRHAMHFHCMPWAYGPCVPHGARLLVCQIVQPSVIVSSTPSSAEDYIWE